MIEFETQTLVARDVSQATLQLYLILYPKELEDEVIQTLEAAGVPGYTELPKMVGRGRQHKHFDNPVWPGATGALFTVISPEQARTALVPTFSALADGLERRSHGLYGVHMFALPCTQLI
jgi:hypothetical protein